MSAPTNAPEAALVAINERLMGDATLKTLLGAEAKPKVFNNVPEVEDSVALLPYVVFSVRPGNDWSDKTNRGWQAEAIMEVFTDYEGDAPSLRILARLRTLFDRVDLPLVVGRVVDMFPTTGEQVQDSNGQSAHGTIRFTLLLEE